MRYVGIDYGLARTGLAYAVSETSAVLPIATFALAHYPTRSALLDALAAKIVALPADFCVIGLPVRAGESESLICRQIKNATLRLMRRVELPYAFMNEALTSEEAWADLAAAGFSRTKRREKVDQIAACRILESYLAARRRACTGEHS